MKTFSFFLLLLLPLSLFANDWTMEIRGAYYLPSSKKFRDDYSSAWIDYQVESAKRINDFVEVWAGVNWMTKKGRHHDYYLGYKERNKVSILPFSLGFKFIYPLTCSLDVYAGAGACYSFLKIKRDWDYSTGDSLIDSSSYKKHEHKNGVGGVAKVGIQWALGPTTFIDIFADYLTQRFHISDTILTDNTNSKRHINCSGFKFGAGFGVYF